MPPHRGPLPAALSRPPSSTPASSRPSTPASTRPSTPTSISLTATPTQTALSTLATESALLHLLHHRNRNQHSRLAWYRHLSAFRRALRRLLLASTTANPLTHKQSLYQTARHWPVPTWHAAFSSLIASGSGQFAPLGVALLGVLARVCGVVGVTAGYVAEGVRREEKEEARVREVLGRFGREEFGVGGGGVGGDGRVGFGRKGGEGEGGEEDLGEVVSGDGSGGAGAGLGGVGRAVVVGERMEREGQVVPRPRMESGTLEEISDSTSAQDQEIKRAEEAGAVKTKAGNRATEQVEVRKKKENEHDKEKVKKRRKKGNAIDDLFAGLR